MPLHAGFEIKRAVIQINMAWLAGLLPAAAAAQPEELVANWADDCGRVRWRALL